MPSLILAGISPKECNGALIRGLWYSQSLGRQSGESIGEALRAKVVPHTAIFLCAEGDRVVLPFLAFRFPSFLRPESLPLFYCFHMIYYGIQKLHINGLSDFSIFACANHKLVLQKGLCIKPGHKMVSYLHFTTRHLAQSCSLSQSKQGRQFLMCSKGFLVIIRARVKLKEMWTSCRTVWSPDPSVFLSIQEN